MKPYKVQEGMSGFSVVLVKIENKFPCSSKLEVSSTPTCWCCWVINSRYPGKESGEAMSECSALSQKEDEKITLEGFLRAQPSARLSEASEGHLGMVCVLKVYRHGLMLEQFGHSESRTWFFKSLRTYISETKSAFLGVPASSLVPLSVSWTLEGFLQL